MEATIYKLRNGWHYEFDLRGITFYHRNGFRTKRGAKKAARDRYQRESGIYSRSEKINL